MNNNVVFVIDHILRIFKLPLLKCSHEAIKFGIKPTVNLLVCNCCSQLLYQNYTLVQSSLLSSLLQYILYTDKWVLTLQWGDPLCFKQLEHTETERMRESAPGLDLRVGKSDSKLWVLGMRREGGKGARALSGNLQVAKLFKALLSTLGCPFWP